MVQKYPKDREENKGGKRHGFSVYQGRNTGKTTVKIQNTAEKGAETQNTTGGRQHAAEKKGIQGALLHS
jgi:hypothetical protein